MTMLYACLVFLLTMDVYECRYARTLVISSLACLLHGYVRKEKAFVTVVAVFMVVKGYFADYIDFFGLP